MAPPRRPPLDVLTDFSYPGTADLVSELLRQSTNVPAWRPVRAAAMVVRADVDRNGPWMTAEEFGAWLERHFPLRSHRANELPGQVGIGLKRRRLILEGDPVTKIEALACAHYALGLPLPIQPGDVETFGAWFTPRFGAAAPANEALAVNRQYINMRLIGHAIRDGGVRVERLPDAGLIRALDWCWRIGAICPYGERTPTPFFPEQSTEVF